MRNTKFSILKTKANNLEKEIPDTTNFILTDQYNTDKLNLEKKMEMFLVKWFSDYSCFEYKN